ncbi:hypothetical protein [Nonomuraea basaltis]|uniref:hypothetical protein n=1 Tax=Nonomuraea basaltis TaxID=2495887 RepID=UPI00110C418A|nr:hypothetical protein [Nonomuraea basaltis]TMR99503.1 hypothetical protein EJK15_06735 [Nonomuraea basaltis]
MTVFPVEDGVLIVPAVLPIRLSNADLKLTVADWLALNTLTEEDVMPDDELPPRPWMDADVTEFDPDQSWLPQAPGSVVEDESPEEEVEGGEEA